MMVPLPMPPPTVSVMVSDTLIWSWREGAGQLHTLLSRHTRAQSCLCQAKASTVARLSLSLVPYRGDTPRRRGLSHPIPVKPYPCRSIGLRLRGVLLVGVKRCGEARSANHHLAGPLSRCLLFHQPPPHHLLHFTTPLPPKLQTPLYRIRPQRGRGTRVVTMSHRRFQ